MCWNDKQDFIVSIILLIAMIFTIGACVKRAIYDYNHNEKETTEQVYIVRQKENGKLYLEEYYEKSN